MTKLIKPDHLEKFVPILAEMLGTPPAGEIVRDPVKSEVPQYKSEVWEEGEMIDIQHGHQHQSDGIDSHMLGECLVAFALVGSLPMSLQPEVEDVMDGEDGDEGV